MAQINDENAEKTFDDLLRMTRITIHGGMDYKEEKAEAFNFNGKGHGHPICSVAIGDTVRHFKCTTTNIHRSKKSNRKKNHFYQLQDREHCQMDQTEKVVLSPHKQTFIDFNHSIYLVNDETPPLPVYPNGIQNGAVDQTAFELSETDKIGVLNHLLKLEHIYGKVEQPSVSQQECRNCDNKRMKNNPSHSPHPIQVVNKDRLELNLDDLDFANDVADYLFE